MCCAPFLPVWTLCFSPPPHHLILSVCLSVCVRPWSLFFHVIITIMVNMRANTAVLAQRMIQNSQCKEMTYLSPKYGLRGGINKLKLNIRAKKDILDKGMWPV